MRLLVIVGVASLSACSPAPAAPEADLAPPSWSKEFHQFCDQKRARWLADLVDRFEAAMSPAYSTGSVRVEGVNLQAPFDGAAGDEKELQLRLTASAAGDERQFSAYGKVSPGQCFPTSMTAIEGFNRFEARGEFEF